MIPTGSRLDGAIASAGNTGKGARVANGARSSEAPGHTQCLRGGPGPVSLACRLLTALARCQPPSGTTYEQGGGETGRNLDLDLCRSEWPSPPSNRDDANPKIPPPPFLPVQIPPLVSPRVPRRTRRSSRSA